MDTPLDRSEALAEAIDAPLYPDDRRQQTRHATLLQVAKIVGEYYEELCILRDVSSTGLRAETYWHVHEGDQIAVEFRSGRTVSGRVVWTDGKLLGMQFDMPIPVSVLLDRRANDDKAPRRPRLNVSLSARLRADGRDIAVHVCDVSQAGMGLRTDAMLLEGSACDITLDALGRRGATVRWCQEGKAGLMLFQPLSYNEFAEWRLALSGQAAVTAG